MVKELMRRTDQQENKKSNKDYDRITISLDRATFTMFDDFCIKVRRETGFKIAKSDIVAELIKLIPDLKLQAFYLGSSEDLKNQFETIKKKLNQIS